MKTLAQADVFLINGAGMESYLTNITKAFPNLPVVDASQGIALLDEHDLPVHEEEEDDEHDHDHEGHHHDHEEVNAHIWLDPQRAMVMVDNLCHGLCAIYPQYTDALQANKDAYTQRLSALHEELTAVLSPLPNRAIITFHEAFPYFAHSYGLEVAAVINREPGEALSPAQLSDLIVLVQELGAPPLFVEPQYDDMAARTLAAETGAPVFVLDPVVTGPVGEEALPWYETTMRQNMATLLEALGNP